MTRRVWTPRAQILPTDVIVSDPQAPDPDALVEVDRTAPAPVLPEVDTPPPDGTVGALVTTVLALADALTDPKTAGPGMQRIKDARAALDAAAKGRKP